jgi:DNA-directed RNA polymerase specialized sigma24 family protein
MMVLPAEEREILLHANYLGWPVERIAHHFDISADVVKSRLHDAMHRLLAADQLRVEHGCDPPSQACA